MSILGPKRHGLNPNDPRRICVCGNPNCTVGLSDTEGAGSGSFRASEESSRKSSYEVAAFKRNILEGRPRDSVMSSAQPNYDRALAELYSEGKITMERVIKEQYPVMQTTIYSPFIDRASGPPSSYTSARNAVEEYILETKHSVAWDDVIGNDTAKLALRDAIEAPVKEAELYAHYGLRPPKGVLLYGPPGCGKTMFAKASATAIGQIYKTGASEVIVLAGTQLQQPYIGQTEKIIREIFHYAREYEAYHKHPLVIFMDECEVFLPDRTGNARSVASWEESNVATFLTELDGMNALGAFVILATNRPESLDQALLRDGRIDRKIKVERPNRLAVEHIIKNGLKSAPLADDLTSLVFAGVEALYDAAYVLTEGHILIGHNGKLERDIAHNFCLEHIVSGALAAGIPGRAKLLAFQRDRDSGTITGIKVTDMIGAVRQVYEENKGLDHAYALREFVEAVPMREMIEPRRKMQ